LDWLTAQNLVRGRRVEYSVGFGTKHHALTSAITAIPERVWTPAVDADGEPRNGADVAEVTGLVNLTGWPAGMRVIVRRERRLLRNEIANRQVEGGRHVRRRFWILVEGRARKVAAC
jgi:hypothetical protein